LARRVVAEARDGQRGRRLRGSGKRPGDGGAARGQHQLERQHEHTPRGLAAPVGLPVSHEIGEAHRKSEGRILTVIAADPQFIR
jgi:hypothetical protein